MSGLDFTLLMLMLTLTGCAAIIPHPTSPVVWYHNGHEELIIRDHEPYRPDGKHEIWGTPMTCWVTGKEIGMEDLTLEGRRVYAN